MCFKIIMVSNLCYILTNDFWAFKIQENVTESFLTLWNAPELPLKLPELLHHSFRRSWKSLELPPLTVPLTFMRTSFDLISDIQKNSLFFQRKFSHLK